MAITTTIKHTVAKGIKNNEYQYKKILGGGVILICQSQIYLFGEHVRLDCSGPSFVSYIGAGTSF